MDAYIGAAAIVPNDTTTFMPTKGISVSVAGDLKVDTFAGGTVTLTGLQVGYIHPLAVTRVYATGTVATGVIGYF